MSGKPVPIEKRFWPKVEKTDGCWIWRAFRDPKGYGRISIHNAGQMAHRISYEMHVGPVPDDLCVLHRCDNPPCVNPDHLFLGTRADNNRDMDAKGRRGVGAPRGEQSPQAKLTSAQVLEMRTRFGYRQAPQAALAYGISHCTAWKILTRRAWRHI